MTLLPSLRHPCIEFSFLLRARIKERERRVAGKTRILKHLPDQPGIVLSLEKLNAGLADVILVLTELSLAGFSLLFPVSCQRLCSSFPAVPSLLNARAKKKREEEKRRLHLVPEIETFLSDSYKRFRLSLRFQSPRQVSFFSSSSHLPGYLLLFARAFGKKGGGRFLVSQRAPKKTHSLPSSRFLKDRWMMMAEV